LAEWPGLPYLARRLKDLPADTPVAVYPWIPADSESSGMVPGYLIAASRIDVAGVELPDDEEPTSPPPPSPPPPEEPPVETWYVAVDKGQTLRLRSGAGTGFSIIGQLPRGEELKIRGRFFVNGVTWTEVLEPAKGYTAADYLSLVHPDPVPPVVETETRYATGAGLRVRSAPNASADNIVATLAKGTAVTVQKGVLVDGVNGDANKWRVRTSPSRGYIADQFMSLEPPKVDAPPPIPPATGLKWFGLHRHQGSLDPADVDRQLVTSARAGVLDCAVVINDIGAANMLYEAGCKTVIIRPVQSLDRPPALSGTSSDYAVGRDWAAQWINVAFHHALHRGIYLQPFAMNENGMHNDAYFVLGQADEFQRMGRLFAAWGDAVGNPADFNFDARQGRFVSEIWDMRVRVGTLRTIKRNNGLYVYHGYGYMTPGGKESDAPGCALRFDASGNVIWQDDEAWFWYGGRAFSYYDKLNIPFDSQPDVVLGECGPSDAIYRGPEQVIHELKGYRLRLANEPRCRGYAFWTTGGTGPFGFGYSTIDTGLPIIRLWMEAQRSKVLTLSGQLARAA
jgi:hypothetical protein